MDQAFEREVEMLERRKKGEQIDMRFWTSEARQAKRRFWRAHSLASRFEFRVWLSYKEYLNLPAWAL
jgi:hypothetical protein